MDCLIISYSEASRDRERHQFFNEDSKSGDGWSRFLHINYIEYENDILLPNHLASIARLESQNQSLARDADGQFDIQQLSTYSAWKIPLLGGLYLYQYLKSLSLDVGLIQHVQLEQDSLDEKLATSPAVIGISTTLILNPTDVLELVRYCRERSPESKIVLGGGSVWNAYLARRDKPSIFRAYGADAIVIDARGAQTFGRVVKAIVNDEPLDDIPNLFLYGDSERSTELKPETFSFEDQAMDWDQIEPELTGAINLVRTQISCPFSCSFCSYPTSAGPVIQSNMNCFEQELILLKQRGAKYLLFIDDTFNVPIQRFKAILTVLKKYDFHWYAFIRCQYLDSEQAADMYASGCRGAYLGIESGSNTILKNMNKKATRDQYLKGVELLRTHNIPTYASFIIGFPGETDETYRDTVDFITQSGIDFYNVKIFYYDSTTPIATQAETYNLTGSAMHWKHNTMSSEDAFSRAETLIQEIKDIPYIPQHSGEIWELAYFNERGYSLKELKQLYSGFTNILSEQLRTGSSTDPLAKQVLQGLVPLCKDK